MMEREERFIRRLETEFTSGGVTHRGISSDLSLKGLFIRSRHGLAPDSTLDIKIYLPDGKAALAKGIVRKTVKTDSEVSKNGMGIELFETDSNYVNFIKSFTEEEYLMITCTECRAKNKVPKAKLHLGPKCGNCKARLRIS